MEGPDVEIVELAEEIWAVLVVMGRRGRGRIRRTYGERLWLGCLHARCPVCVVPREEQQAAPLLP
jgi:nucleotide-binding universal stress UspA family protein